jgi:hypothetical protein
VSDTRGEFGGLKPLLPISSQILEFLEKIKRIYRKIA